MRDTQESLRYKPKTVIPEFRSLVMHKAMLLLFISCMTGCVTTEIVTQWDGGYPTGHYTFNFVNADGAPITGVVIDVVDEAGKFSFKYPVDEYVAENSLVTDANGRVSFSHTSYGLEFGGTCYSDGEKEWGDCVSPKYTIVFRRGQEVIHQISYGTLSSLGDEVTVKYVIGD